MKKLLSIILVMVMLLPMSVTAFAASGTTGSITITNATIGQTYYLYKFFDATYAVDGLGNLLLDSNGDVIVSYTIDKDNNQFFDDLFGVDGTTPNTYFTYDVNTGVVTRRSGFLDSEIIAYLDGIANGASVTPDASEVATSSTLVFDSLPTGYYLIDRGISSIVTITNNMPDVEVIDKNQTPNVGGTFNKQVWDEELGAWTEVSSAMVGDIIDWKIDFVATNYDGDEVVLYYSIRDNKSPSLWVEFNSITVKVGMTTLGKGYYWCAGDPSINTLEWTAAQNPAQWAATPEDADWYLIHYGYDDFEIVIPWLDDYTFTGVTSTIKGYDLTFDLDTEDGNGIYSTSMYPSPSTVVVEYSAAVGPSSMTDPVRNSATLDWVTPEGTFGPENSETTETKVYNMGITKVANDGTPTSPATRLAGAVFGLYKDAACTQPIYVIPTNNEGVYILDDVGTIISGAAHISARDYYLGYWEAYIGPDTSKKRNDMVTPANGQLVILGLEAGTYYLKELEAPLGYNKLSTPVEVLVGSGTTSVYNNGYKDLSNADITYTVYDKTITNNAGVILPSTGGEGTFWLITIGTLMAIGFAVFLITHKKMSVYTD